LENHLILVNHIFTFNLDETNVPYEFIIMCQ